MADFCKQCSIDMFGEDYKGLAGLISEEDVKKGFLTIALCEDCGPTYVDHTGECKYKNCQKHHGESNDQ